jgi:hypothetical protein
MRNTVNFNNPVSIQEAWRLIAEIGADQTILLQGEPGIAKSSTEHEMKRILGDTYDHVFIDGATVDMGDLFIRAPDRDEGVLAFYPTELMKPKSSKPKFVLIDESNKCDKFMQRIFTRLALDHFMGDYKLPDGSMVVMTSNLSSDGVGDNMLAHMGNRITILNIRKPTANEWLTWASDNNIATEIRAWVAMNPRSLASYLDGGQDDNPYIFNPRNKVLSFVTPRSLAKSSPIVKKRDKLGSGLTQSALAGTVGMAAAESMAAFLSLAKELVSIKDVIADPDNVSIPEKPAALFMMMFNAIDTLETQDDLSKFMQFVNRIKSSEVQSVFFTMLLQSKRTVKLAKNNQRVTEWAKDNYELLI